MKRKIQSLSILLPLLLLSVSALAGNGNDEKILKEIKARGELFETLSSDFRQIKTLAANGKEIKSEGKLYYRENHFSMHYTNPEKDVLIINEERFFMIQGKKKRNFDITKNKPIANLSHTLLYSMNGDLQRLSEEVNADLTANEEEGLYVISLKAREKTPRGYSEIIIKYDKDSGYQVEMTMTEFNGNSTLYIMEHYTQNQKLEESLFEIPK